MFSQFPVQSSAPTLYANNISTLELTTTGYFVECAHCGTRTVATSSAALCSYCSNYQSVRQAAATLAAPKTATQTPVAVTPTERKPPTPRVPRPLLPAPACAEFQTSSAMYERLSTTLKTFYQANASSQPPYLAFHGSYSIIADPTLLNARQALLVSQDLKKIVKLDHHHNGKPKSVNSLTSVLSCRCDCDRRVVRRMLPPPVSPAPSVPPAPPAPPAPQMGSFRVLTPASQKPVPKHKQTSLNGWILHAGAKKVPVRRQPASTPAPAAVTAQTEPREEYKEEVLKCEGVIRITVAEDLSHRFFRGQKITVEVCHPARS